jgi:hypothetical protein
MISKKTIAAGLIALTSLAAVPASASSLTIEFGGTPGYGNGYGGHGYKWDNYDHRDRGYRHGRYRLSPQEIRWILRDRGYHDIRFFDRQGAVYEVRARRHGEAYYLVVSARSGEVLSRNRI